MFLTWRLQNEWVCFISYHHLIIKNSGALEDFPIIGLQYKNGWNWQVTVLFVIKQWSSSGLKGDWLNSYKTNCVLWYVLEIWFGSNSTLRNLLVRWEFFLTHILKFGHWVNWCRNYISVPSMIIGYFKCEVCRIEHLWVV